LLLVWVSFLLSFLPAMPIVRGYAGDAVAPIHTVVVLMLTSALVAGMGFWFRGGPVFRLAGIEVLHRDGQPASRVRCAVRNLLAWAPVLIMIAMQAGTIVVFKQREDATSDFVANGLMAVPFIAVLTGMIPVAIIGTIFALVRPQRGLQDLFAGTCLVPR
jgi:hypothetical protein